MLARLAPEGVVTIKVVEFLKAALEEAWQRLGQAEEECVLEELDTEFGTDDNRATPEAKDSR